MLGGSPRKLRDDAEVSSVSPDGSLIAFATNYGKFGPREIWLMGANGEQPRKVFDTDENSAIAGRSILARWSAPHVLQVTGSAWQTWRRDSISRPERRTSRSGAFLGEDSVTICGCLTEG